MGLQAQTPGGIAYEELGGSPTFNVTREGYTAVQRWRIAWSDVDNLIEEIFPESVSGVYFLPMQFPNKPWLYANSVAIDNKFEGGDQASTWNATSYTNDYTWANVTINYSTVQWEQQGTDPGGDTTLRTTDVSIGSEFLRMPGYRMQWINDPSGDPVPAAQRDVVEEDIDLGKLIPTLEYSITWHHAASLDLATIIDKIGHVNSTNDVIADADDETVLYLGASANRTTTWKGTSTWRITHRFSEKRQTHAGSVYGWNHFWRPGDDEATPAIVAGFYEVQTPEGNPIFPATTFIELFQ